MGAVQLIQHLFDDVFGNKNPQLVTVIPLGFMVLYFFNGIARYFHLYLIRFTSDQISTDVRKDLKEKLVSLNLSFHGRYEGGSGGLLSRTLNDVTILQSGIVMISDLLREPFLAIFLIAKMFFEDWRLSLVCFTIAPILGIILRQISKSLRKYGHKSQEALESLTALVKESLDGMRIIQSYNLEGEMTSRFHRAATHFLDTRKKIVSREEIAGPISEILGAALFAGICIYMGHQIINGNSTVGVFMAFVAALGYMQKPIKKLQEAFIKLQQSGVAAERLLAILNNLEKVPEVEDPKPFPHSWREISFDHISFRYDQALVLNDVNFKIHRGEMVALVGESGSGKSTLVQLFERFFDPTTGSICIDGTSIRELSLKDLRAHIALVTQDVFLFNDTIEQNILSGDFSKSFDDVVRAAKLAHAHDFVEKLPQGYKTRIGDRGGLISGGEKQRVSIARAILKDAPILILDEATSALDSASEIEVQKGLEELLKGRTALVIAHRLSTVQKADRILVIRAGVILEEGTHSELLAKQGEYHRFHKLQHI